MSFATVYWTDVFTRQVYFDLLTDSITPIIVLVLGAIVAVVLIAMYLPMFRLSTVMA